MKEQMGWGLVGGRMCVGGGLECRRFEDEGKGKGKGQWHSLRGKGGFEWK